MPQRLVAPAVAVLIAIVVFIGCAKEQDAPTTGTSFAENRKTGGVSLTIIGDYFHHRYALELAQIAQALSPGTQQVFFCTDQYKNALEPFLAANGITGVEYVTFEPSSTILTQWARDIAVAGEQDGTKAIVVSPDKHAETQLDAEATARLLQATFPDFHVRIAPVVFEAGNITFANSGVERVLIIGRKVLFDNAVYQKRPWADGLDEQSVVAALGESFGVDAVRVVGRAPVRPDSRMYFEYHIDMGMVMLEGDRGIVSRLDYGDGERAELSRVVHNGGVIITPFNDPSIDAEHLIDLLSERLQTVAMEYEDYATLLDSLGVDVYRSDTDWRHVLASMSGTNVIQVGDRIFMPLYPDTLRGVTRQVGMSKGQVQIVLDVSGIDEERFELGEFNQRNYALYRSLGYDVVTVPEYLHYMMGGIHCFVNVLE